MTFYKDLLWWAFAGPGVSILSDDSKTRSVIGQWTSRDLRGQPLQTRRLSGKLLMMQGFRGTICSVRELDYLRRRIAADLDPQVQATTSARHELVKNVQIMVQSLYWDDFELLIDLLLQRAGWNRVSEVGGPEKTLDITLLAPITGTSLACR